MITTATRTAGPSDVSDAKRDVVPPYLALIANDALIASYLISCATLMLARMVKLPLSSSHNEPKESAHQVLIAAQLLDHPFNRSQESFKALLVY
jgi:hypothetical protein